MACERSRGQPDPLCTDAVSVVVAGRFERVPFALESRDYEPPISRRFVGASFETRTDLERIGDHAVTIAARTRSRHESGDTLI